LVITDGDPSEFDFEIADDCFQLGIGADTTVNGQQYDHEWCITTGPGQVGSSAWPIARAYTHLSGVIGVADRCPSDRYYKFHFEADGVTIASGVTTYGQPVAISANVSGVLLLRFVAEVMHGSYDDDYCLVVSNLTAS
jgi:hypothetical protein